MAPEPRAEAKPCEVEAEIRSASDADLVAFIEGYKWDDTVSVLSRWEQKRRRGKIADWRLVVRGGDGYLEVKQTPDAAYAPPRMTWRERVGTAPTAVFAVVQALEEPHKGTWRWFLYVGRGSSAIAGDGSEPLAVSTRSYSTRGQALRAVRRVLQGVRSPDANLEVVSRQGRILYDAKDIGKDGTLPRKSGQMVEPPWHYGG